MSLEGLVREVWTKIDLCLAAITLIFMCGGGGHVTGNDVNSI